MPGLFKRWLIARDVDRGSAAQGDPDRRQYAQRLNSVDRRLRFEAPLNAEDPPPSLRSRTIHRLHHARSPHRRPGGYRPAPRLALAFMWVGLLGAVAILVANVGDLLPSTTAHQRAEAEDGGTGLDRSALYAEVDSLEIGHDLDDVAHDARRAADFVFSQLIPKAPAAPPQQAPSTADDE